MTIRLGLVVTGMVLSASALLAGHHSPGMFDINREITLEGTVVQVSWQNPHPLFFVEGKRVDEPSAPARRWILEAVAISNLMRAGWTKDSVQVGAKVTATGHPGRGGASTVLMQTIKIGDKVLVSGDFQGVPFLEAQQERKAAGRPTRVEQPDTPGEPEESKK